ncbi:MAG: hypothetical protein LEGION0398_MBIBDBAK_01409 [Legionellaceae bacterium]
MGDAITQNKKQALQEIQAVEEIEIIKTNDKKDDHIKNRNNSDKKSVIVKTFGLVLLGLGAAVVIAGIATLFTAASIISIPLSASLIGFGSVLLTSGFIMSEVTKQPVMSIKSNTKSTASSNNTSVPTLIKTSQGNKALLTKDSNNNQNFFSQTNNGQGNLLIDFTDSNSVERSAPKNG